MTMGGQLRMYIVQKGLRTRNQSTYRYTKDGQIESTVHIKERTELQKRRIAEGLQENEILTSNIGSEFLYQRVRLPYFINMV